MNELVCLDMPNGPALVARMKRAWDNGDAIFPLDQRLPTPSRNTILNAIRPTIIATENEETRIAGQPVQTGDAVVIATSGTTGIPKGVVLTHDAVQASATATSEYLHVTASDCWLACLPVSHIGGLSVLLRSISRGTQVIAVSHFTPETYVEASNNGATLVSLVATALQRVDPTLFRAIVLGGARPPELMPPNAVATYGMTETGSGIVYNGHPLRGVEIRIVNGVIEVRAPMLLRAYRDGTSPLDAEGWFRTGDIGDFDGRILSVQGREGDLIITGGENVWPQQVEDALTKHNSVLEVCVAGVPDREWGHSVHAWIVLNEDQVISLDETRDFVKQTLPSYCAPKELHIVSSIPRTSLGKPQRALLISQLTRN